MWLIKANSKEEAILKAKVIAEVDFENYDFGGWNCNDYIDSEEDECSGWDGVSHRCNCGNRRVEWVADNTKDKDTFEVYGFAY